MPHTRNAKPGLGGSRAGKLLLALLAPVTILGMLEVGCRLVGVSPIAERTFGNFSFGLVWAALPEPLVFRPHPTRLYEPRPDLRGVVRTDRLGFRGPERSEPSDNTIRIAVLGDSTVFGFGVFDGDGFVARTAAALRAFAPSRDFDVINAGCYGYTSWQNRLDLDDRVLPLAPAIVVLCLSGFNDSVGALEVDDEEWTNRAQRADSWFARALRTSRAVALLERRLPAASPRGTDPALEAAKDDVLAGGRTAGRRVEVAKFERNVRAMIDRVRAAGAEPVLMSHSFRADALAEDPERARYGATLAALATATGVGFVDGATALEHGAIAHYFDRIHPTEAGHDRLAAELAEYLTVQSSLRERCARLARPQRWPRLGAVVPERVIQPAAIALQVEGEFAGDPRPRFLIGGNPADADFFDLGHAEVRVPALPAGTHDLTVLTRHGSDTVPDAVIVAPPTLSVERRQDAFVVTIEAGIEASRFELHVAAATGDRPMMLRRRFALDPAAAIGSPLTGSLAGEGFVVTRGSLEFPLRPGVTLPTTLHLQALVLPDVDACRAADRFAISYPSNPLAITP